MKINRMSSFFSNVCVFFTLLLFAKIILEYCMDYTTFDTTRENIVFMFIFCVIGLFVLEQHKRYERFPMVLVLIIQYMIALAIVMLLIWVYSNFLELKTTAYRDVFASFTIPYIIGAIWYYFDLICEARSANQILEKCRKRMDRQ